MKLLYYDKFNKFYLNFVKGVMGFIIWQIMLQKIAILIKNSVFYIKKTWINFWKS